MDQILYAISRSSLARNKTAKVIHSYKFYTNPIFSVLIICTLAFSLSKCTNDNSSLREQEIERKEAELRAKELDLREQTVKPVSYTHLH